MDFSSIYNLIIGNPLEVGGLCLLGVIIPFIITKFLKRKATRRFLYKWWSRIYKILGSFNIPVVSGKAEDSIKEAIRASSVDESIARISARLGYHPERLFELIKNDSAILKWNNPAEEESYRKKK